MYSQINKNKNTNFSVYDGYFISERENAKDVIDKWIRDDFIDFGENKTDTLPSVC